MAITRGSAGGGSGTGNSKISGTTLVPTLVGTMNAGSLVIMVVVADNIGTTTVDDTAEHSVNDTAGNTWTKLRETRNAQGAAGGGVTISMWYSILTNSLVTGTNSVTITFSSAITAKAARLVCYTGSLGRGFSKLTPAATQWETATDPAAMVSPTRSGENLVIRMVGAEQPTGTTTTVTVGWTLTNQDGTTGGSAITNVAVFAEDIISSALPVTSNPTWGATDNASILGVFYETPQQSLVAPTPGTARVRQRRITASRDRW